MTRYIAPVTGPGITSRWGFEATDLGQCRVFPNGKTAFVFGDTFEKVDTRTGRWMGRWMSPVIALTSQKDFSGPIVFDDVIRNGRAEQLWPYQHDNPVFSTVLPTDMIVIGNRIYLHVMVHKGLGNVRWTEIQYSDDNGQTWRHGGHNWRGDAHNGMMQVWTWEYDPETNYVYVLSTAFRRTEGILMHRVRPERILDPSGYEPWGWRSEGGWKWGNPPTPIIPGRIGEMCLRRVDGRVVLLYLDLTDPLIVIRARVAEHFLSNWHEPLENKAVIRNAPWAGWSPGGEAFPQPYGPSILPDARLNEQDGFRFICSQWRTGGEGGWPYRVCQFAATMGSGTIQRQQPPPPQAEAAPSRVDNLPSDFFTELRNLLKRFLG